MGLLVTQHGGCGFGGGGGGGGGGPNLPRARRGEKAPSISKETAVGGGGVSAISIPVPCLHRPPRMWLLRPQSSPARPPPPSSKAGEHGNKEGMRGGGHTLIPPLLWVFEQARGEMEKLLPSSPPMVVLGRPKPRTNPKRNRGYLCAFGLTSGKERESPNSSSD